MKIITKNMILLTILITIIAYKTWKQQKKIKDDKIRKKREKVVPLEIYNDIRLTINESPCYRCQKMNRKRARCLSFSEYEDIIRCDCHLNSEDDWGFFV